ncbi:hypothetical protein CLU79DRAFT_92702 [Phycomyces nitens]|nr:hypothetical protein CLU79DRAFT_92702 [Phycomyces nitens]
MGNSSSRHTVSSQSLELGSTIPNNIYPHSKRDYDDNILKQLILNRRLGPFYKGTLGSHGHGHGQGDCWLLIIYIGQVEPQMSLRGSVECPICFLYYPSDINYTRCCDQPICTECFLHIQPTPDTSQASCPYCVQDTFGVIYTSWHTNKTSEIHHSTFGQSPARKRRCAIEPASPRVVLVGHLRLPKRQHRNIRYSQRDMASLEAWMVQQAIRQSGRIHVEETGVLA